MRKPITCPTRRREWANEAVEKLRKAKLVLEVIREDLLGINPLTVALNSKGKRSLCLDLSRYYNKVSKAPKFRIESTHTALQIIERDNFMFSFNLKSDYLQIKVNRNFVKYLGLAIEDGMGRKQYFQYLNLPFCLNDMMRVLTKLFCSPIE